MLAPPLPRGKRRIGARPESLSLLPGRLFETPAGSAWTATAPGPARGHHRLGKIAPLHPDLRHRASVAIPGERTDLQHPAIDQRKECRPGLATGRLLVLGGIHAGQAQALRGLVSTAHREGVAIVNLHGPGLAAGGLHRGHRHSQD